MAVVAHKLQQMAVRKTRLDTGLWGWITTVDHKRIGILYLLTGFFFLVVGGIEALMIRLQLSSANNTVLDAQTYNQMITQHGTVMIFFAVMPIIFGFFNYFMPLMIGARDVAFPRLNMFSYWLLLSGAIVLNSAWLFGTSPDGGWMSYPTLSSKQYSGMGTDFYLIALQIAGVGTLISGLNFLVTILRMRAPGMGLMQMPPFVWFTLIVSVLALIAMPPFTVGMILLMADRLFGTGFFTPAVGGDVYLWQHLFWMFGHPEVYILALPAFAVISEVLPTFSRKPFFGYTTMVIAISAIAVLSYIVWAHHMYTIGMGPMANTAFALTTKAISVPTGILLFNWIATLWRGHLRFTTALHYAVGFLIVFTMGGLTGLVLASSSLNPQLQDTYFVVGHFHYVAIGGVLFSSLAGISYWFPKMFGRMMNETLGKISFWLVFAGFNVTFFVMHVLGLMGMPRRVYTYTPDMGFDTGNLITTIAAFTLAAGILVFVINAVYSLLRGQPAGADPWDGRSLEWATSSPPPAYNFAKVPLVRGREPLWLEKQAGNGKMQPAPEDDHEHGGHGGLIHMPSPSYMPAIVGLGLTVMGYGLIFKSKVEFLAYVGIGIVLIGILGWVLEDASGYYMEPEGDSV